MGIVGKGSGIPVEIVLVKGRDKQEGAGSAYERGIFRLRADPTQQQLVRNCYLDDPLEAARRFAASEEFSEVCRILSLGTKGKGTRVLDVGCGNGIASFAFASMGCDVVAVEPDSSPIVGGGAMARLMPNLTAGSIQLVALSVGEYRDPAGGFDVVYTRQVAHHFPVLEEGLARCTELLKPGGVLLLTREHVADTPQDVVIFRQRHVLVKDGVEEQAYPASRYRNAMAQAGLTSIREWGPYESVINFYPVQLESVRGKAHGLMKDRFGTIIAFLCRYIPFLERLSLTFLSKQKKTPGRLFTFRGIMTSSHPWRSTAPESKPSISGSEKGPLT